MMHAAQSHVHSACCLCCTPCLFKISAIFIVLTQISALSILFEIFSFVLQQEMLTVAGHCY